MNVENILILFEDYIRTIEKDYNGIEKRDNKSIIRKIINDCLPFYDYQINKIFIENITEIVNKNYTFRGGISLQEDIKNVLYDYLSNMCWSIVMKKYPELLK